MSRLIIDAPDDAKAGEALRYAIHLIREGHAICGYRNERGETYFARRTKKGASCRFVEGPQP